MQSGEGASFLAKEYFNCLNASMRSLSVLIVIFSIMRFFSKLLCAKIHINFETTKNSKLSLSMDSKDEQQKIDKRGCLFSKQPLYNDCSIYLPLRNFTEGQKLLSSGPYFFISELLIHRASSLKRSNFPGPTCFHSCTCITPFSNTRPSP